MRIQLPTSEDPPCDRNGVVMPVSGMSLVTPPDDDEHLQGQHEGEAAYQQLGERVLDQIVAVRSPRCTISP